MARMSKSERIVLWLDRLKRFHASGQAVAEFCRCEGISQPSFYQWKRRLLPSVDAVKSTRSGGSRGSFTELSVATKQPTFTRIQLPHDVVIELGCEQATVATVMDQLLSRCLSAIETSEDSSC